MSKSDKSLTAAEFEARRRWFGPDGMCVYVAKQHKGGERMSAEIEAKGVTLNQSTARLQWRWPIPLNG